MNRRALAVVGLSRVRVLRLSVVASLALCVTGVQLASFVEPASALAANDITTVAGGGALSGAGHAALGEAVTPSSTAVDSAGDLFFLDEDQDVVEEVPAVSGTQFGVAMTAGDIYAVAGRYGYPPSDADNVVPPDGISATSAVLEGNCSTSYCVAIAVDGAGDLFISGVIADGTSGLGEPPYGGFVEEVPTASGTHFGQAMTAGDLYRVAGTGAGSLAGMGGPATAAAFGGEDGYGEYGIAVDSQDDLFIAASGAYAVLEVPATTGAHLGTEMTADHIYDVAGTGTAGTTTAGTAARTAPLAEQPGMVAVDSSGDVFVAEWASSDEKPAYVLEVPATSGTRFGKAMTADDIYPVVGGGEEFWDGAAGPVASAYLTFPYIASDAAGDLVLTTSDGNDLASGNVVYDAPAESGTFYATKMTAGDIYPVAGTGTQGDTGDGGPAGAAELSTPSGVAVDPGGDVLVADQGNNRVREVTGSGTTKSLAVTGTVTYSDSGNAEPVPAAEVQACSTTSASTCSAAGAQTSSDGTYTVTVPTAGTYNVTAYPSPLTADQLSLGDGEATSVSVTAPNGASTVNITMPPLAGIETQGASFTSADGTTSSSGVPTVFWDSPQTLSLTNTDCPVGEQETLTSLTATGTQLATGDPSTVSLPVTGQTDSVSYTDPGLVSSSDEWDPSAQSVTETQTVAVPLPPAENAGLHGLVEYTPTVSCQQSLQIVGSTPAGDDQAQATMATSRRSRLHSDALTRSGGSQLVFGDVPYGAGSPGALDVVTVHNTGKDSAYVGLALSGDGYSLDESDCGAFLSPGYGCAVQVKFVPQASKYYYGTLTMGSTSIGLLGRGAPAVIGIEPGFGVFSGPATKTFTVTNNSSDCDAGTCPVTIDQDDVIGDGSMTVEGDTCNGTTITATQTCFITVQYQPQDGQGVCDSENNKQDNSGELRVFSNDPSDDSDSRLSIAQLFGSTPASGGKCPPPGGGGSSGGGGGGGSTVLPGIPQKVDPSGTVYGQSASGGTTVPLSGATATLVSGSSTTDPGGFTTVAADPSLISPATNPETTSSVGGYMWEVVPGNYAVQATDTADGCTAADSSVVVVPPPALDVNITLTCSSLPAPAASTTTLKAAVKTAPAGSPLPLTAKITSDGSGVPAGSVTFTDGSKTLGTVPVDPTASTATLSPSTLAVGTHTVTATYSGDGSHKASSAAAAVTITGTTPTKLVLSAPAKTLAGKASKITATVEGAGGSRLASEVVRLTVTGANKATVSATTGASGQVVLSYTPRHLGGNTISGYVDTNNDRKQQSTEPSATAQATVTGSGHEKPTISVKTKRVSKHTDRITIKVTSRPALPGAVVKLLSVSGRHRARLSASHIGQRGTATLSFTAKRGTHRRILAEVLARYGVKSGSSPVVSVHVR